MDRFMEVSKGIIKLILILLIVPIYLFFCILAGALRYSK